MMKATQEPLSETAKRADIIPVFFEAIAGPHPAVPRTISGSLRFDLTDGNRTEHWRVTFSKGIVSAARSDAPADCVVRTDRSTMEAILRGQLNAMAALLRGAVKVEGQTLLLAVFRGLPAGKAARTESKRIGSMSGRRS